MTELLEFQKTRPHHRPLPRMFKTVLGFIAASYQCDFNPLPILRTKWPDFEWSEVTSTPKHPRGFRYMATSEIKDASAGYYFLAFADVWVIARPKTDRLNEPSSPTP